MKAELLEGGLATALVILALGGFIVGIILAVNLTEHHGPPFKCGPEGVQAVYPSTGLENHETVIVCKDGHVGRSNP